MFSRLKKICMPTILRLGIFNILKVLLYRIFIYFKIIKLLCPSLNSNYSNYDLSLNQFFLVKNDNNKLMYSFDLAKLLDKANNLLDNKVCFFSNKLVKLQSVNKWIYDPYKNVEYNLSNNKHFSTIKDFEQDFTDVKILWELSRFSWILTYVRAYLVSKEKKYLDSLNLWFIDWVKCNPTNKGVNWKCAQEAAIRSLHVFLAFILLKEHMNVEYNDNLVKFFVQHCERINPTTFYASAQNNNHIISESVALYIISSWILTTDIKDKKIIAKAKSWQKKGLKLLEKNVNKLIFDDGGFAQYSTNYHRFLLSMLSIAEVFRQKLNLNKFSINFYDKSKKATDWLLKFVDGKSKKVANIGENDGSRLFILDSFDYQDYSSILQLSSYIFCGEKVYSEFGLHDEPFFWLKLNSIIGKNSKKDQIVCSKNSNSKDQQVANTYQAKVLSDSGFIIISQNNKHLPEDSWAQLRYPNFKFRPAHADILHFDLWHKGINIFKDGGTYTYADLKWRDYFSSCISHNTIQFDDRDQMPRIKRFLYGCWPKTLYKPKVVVESDNTLIVNVAYKDYKGAIHDRIIIKPNSVDLNASLRYKNLDDISSSQGNLKNISSSSWNSCSEYTGCSSTKNIWVIKDKISNFSNKAILRWRLANSNWEIKDNVCESDLAKIQIISDVKVNRMELVEGWESNYYMEKHSIQVLEVEVSRACTELTSQVELK